MSFNLNNLHRSIEHKGLWSGDVEIYYDFANSSGNLIYNKVYPTGFHFITGDRNKFSYLAYPGLSIGYNDYPVTGSNVSGYFDSSSLVRVGVKNDFSYYLFDSAVTGFQQLQGWKSGKPPALSTYTAFFNLRMSDQNYGTGKSKVLWSTMSSKSGGYTVGFTDTFDICVDWYETGTYMKKRQVLPLKKIGKYNLISISKSHGSAALGDSYSSKVEPIVTVGLHDVAKDTVETSTVLLQDMAAHGDGATGKLMEKWYLGNTPFTSIDYTGYSGYIDDFILINGGRHGETLLKGVADQYFTTGTYQPPRSEVSEVSVTYADSTGSGVSQVEIPTYTYAPSGYGILENVPQLDGAPDIPVYHGSGIWKAGVRTVTSGINTGAKLPVTGYELTEYDEVLEFGGVENLYTDRFITLYDSSNANDAFEVYLEKERIKGKFNLRANFRDFPMDDFDLGSAYTGHEINVYANDLIQFEGLNYTQPEILTRGRVIDLSGGYNGSDVIVYDEQVINPFHSGITGTENLQLTNPLVTGRDVYFFGQKLISGLDYSGNNTTIFVNVSTALHGATGQLYFTEERKKANHFTGLGSTLVGLNEAIIDEQLFLNGVRQVQDLNYALIKNTGIINTGFRIESKTYNVYNSAQTYWNYL